MPYCPKCQHQIAEGAKFCNRCGTPVPEVPKQPEAPRPNVCAKCGQPIQPGAAFCNSCGTPISQAVVAPGPGSQQQTPQKPLIDMAKLGQKATETAKKAAAGTKKLAGAAAEFLKKVPKKFLIMGGAAVVVLIALIIVLNLIAGAGAKDNYALYMKDGQLVYNSLTGDKAPLQVTDRLEYPYNPHAVGAVTTMTEDGKYLFYPDRGDYDSYGFTLYYRNIQKSGAEGVKLDSDISSYSVNKKGNLVTYLKEDTLYQHDLKEKEKVDSDVRVYNVSEDGKKIIYLDEEGGLYSFTSGKDKEKIASDVSALRYCSDDLGTIFYTEGEALYVRKGDSEPERIESDADHSFGFAADGTCYFVVEKAEPVYLDAFIDDDMASEDAAMVEPSWSDSSQEEWDAWYAKELRDDIRASAAEYELYSNPYTLYYFNGKEAVELNSDYESVLDTAADASVVAFATYGDISAVSLPISGYTGVWEMAQAVYNVRDDNVRVYIARGAEVTELRLEDIETVGLSADGKNAYVLTDYSDSECTLYKMAVGQEPEELDTDVYFQDYDTNIRFLDNGDLLYFKDVRDDEGDLCVEKKVIESDVYCYTIEFGSDTNTFLYITDYSSNKEEGTLNLYKGGKTTKVADDVADFRLLPNGNVLYLVDEDLFLFTGKKAKQIDEDVTSIVPVYNRHIHSAW